MVLTAAQTASMLAGKPAYGNDFDLDGALEVCTKATGASTTIAFGKIIVENATTGVWAQGQAGDTGRQGFVPALAPVMTDSSPTFMGVTRAGAEGYVQAGGAIKKNTRCMPGADGKLVQFVEGNVTATPTESTIESAIKDYARGQWVYLGHYGEGSGLDQPATDAVLDDWIRVRKL